MDAQAEIQEVTVATRQRNGSERPAPAGRRATPLHELSPAGRAFMSVAGIGLFSGWLLLFIMGMSLNAGQYTDCLTYPDSRVNWYFLVIYGLLFTPTNCAILASLAGVLGGIASKLAAYNKFRHNPPDLSQKDSDDAQNYVYMTESPLVSMLRGFTTYLIFIAGSYLTTFTTSSDTNNPGQFLGLTASAYFKLAVTVSLLAYLVGYDPSRLKALINSFSPPAKDPVSPIQGEVHLRQKEKETQIDIHPPSAPGTLAPTSK